MPAIFLASIRLNAGRNTWTLVRLGFVNFEAGRVSEDYP
jgi:hypothetical protein